MSMLPLPPSIKIGIECIELGVLTLYLLICLTKEKTFSFYLFVAMWCALGYDIFYYHTIRPIQVWGMVNTPLWIWIGYVIYVKILRKSWRPLVHKVGCLVMLVLHP